MKANKILSFRTLLTVFTFKKKGHFQTPGKASPKQREYKKPEQEQDQGP